MDAHRGLHRIGLLALSALLVGSLWFVPYLPTTDGPEWIFAAHAENHYADPGAPYPALLTPALQFASRGASVVLGPLDAAFGWQRGVQVALSVFALGAAWGFVALVRSVAPERRALAFLGFPLALSWALYMGFWPFVVSFAVGLFILALAVRLRTPGLLARVMLGVLLLVQAVLHVFGAVLVGGVVFALLVARAPRGGRLAESGRVALMGSPAATVLAACAWLSRSITNAPLVQSFVYLSPSETLATLPRVVLPGPPARAIVALALVVAGACLALARSSRGKTTLDDRALGVTGVVLLVAGAFLPFEIPGWQFFSQRFIPLGVVLVIVAQPIEELGLRAQRAASVLLFGLASSSLLLSYPFHRRLAALCPSAIAGFASDVQSRGEILGVSLGPTERRSYGYAGAEVPFMNPLLHMGSVYAVVMGGIPAFSFSGVEAIHPFLRRPSGRPLPDVERFARAIGSDAFVQDPVRRAAVETELALYGLYYDEVAIFGAVAPDVRLWRRLGFEADWQSGATLLAHFVPCTIDFAARGGTDERLPAFDVGVGDVKVLSELHPSPVAGSDGMTHFALSPSPCGPVSIAARWPSGRRCSLADSTGRIRAEAGRPPTHVVCDAE